MHNNNAIQDFMLFNSVKENWWLLRHVERTTKGRRRENIPDKNKNS